MDKEEIEYRINAALKCFEGSFNTPEVRYQISEFVTRLLHEYGCMEFKVILTPRGLNDLDCHVRSMTREELIEMYRKDLE